MAIIQSILVGKGKGKIGNVVLSGLKGQTVAKQLNSSPSNPRTVAQTANRVKMANAVLAWQFLAIFMTNAKGLRKALESVYNAFVRTVVNSMPTVPSVSRVASAVSALASNAFAGNWFSVSIENMGVDSIEASFSTSGIAWLPTYRVSAIIFSTVSGEQKVVDTELSELGFNNGIIALPFETLADADCSAIYIYDSATSKVSNIAYFEV